MTGLSAKVLALYGRAARTLAWRPDEFWRATPAELLAALEPPRPMGDGVDRATLTRMMERDHG